MFTNDVETFNRPELTLLYADMNRHEEAKTHLCAMPRDRGGGRGLARAAGHVARAEAVVVAADGDLDGTEAHFDNAIRIFRRYQVLFEEAEALYYWGRALLSATEKQLHRAGDALVPVAAGRYLAERIPGAKYAELPGDDHLVLDQDTQDIITEEVEQFVTGTRHRPEPDRVLAT